MKMISRILLPVAVLGFIACSDSEKQTTNTATTTVPQNTTAPAAQGATAGLNPEHGQPNHRCDIPVGAPLNSPAQPNLNAPAPTITQPMPPAQAPQGTVAAGTNPPHGQPGHDCAIPVGAPLNK